MAEQDRIRVLRLVEYEGPRDLVEKQVSMSLHGTRAGVRGGREEVRITGVTLGIYPEVIDKARAVLVPHDPSADQRLLVSLEDFADRGGLSVRAYNCLKNGGFNTIGDIVIKTEYQMLKVKGLGRETLYEIRDALAESGLRFGMTET